MATETITTSNPIDQILSLTKDLSAGERYDLAMSLLETIKAAVGGQKKRKAKDPNAPKREVKPESYINLVNKVVWPHLQTLAEAETDPEKKARIRSAEGRTQISVLVWDPIKELATAERLAAMESVTLDTVRTACETWMANPPPAKEKKVKPQKIKVSKIKSEGSDDSSAASEGTKTSKSSKSKLANMSEDEKAAFYKARGAAAAAARAANKATKAESTEAEAEEAPKPVKHKPSKPKPIIASEPEPEPDFGDEQKAWTDPSDNTVYIRQNNLLWNSSDGSWVGEYNPKTKKINRDAPEPTYDEE